MYKRFKQNILQTGNQQQVQNDSATNVSLQNGNPNQQVQNDSATNGFFISQTVYRVKDPIRSLQFYNGVLGMRLLKKLNFEPMEFTLYFLGYEPMDDIPSLPNDKAAWLFSRKALLVLMHNWGSEDDEKFQISNGNENPHKGFGHIGICVPDVEAACQRFHEKNVTFVKDMNEGSLKGLAFIKDPDGYWIEILNPDNMAKIVAYQKSQSATA